MSSFWGFTRHLFKYRWRMTIGLSCALITAICFATTIGFLMPILRTVLGSGGAGGRVTVSEYIQRANEGRWGWLLPDFIVQRLPSGELEGFMVLMGLLIAITLIGALARLTHGYLTQTLVVMAVADIRRRVFNQMIHLPLITMMAEPISEKISRIMRDSKQLGRGFTALLSRTMVELLKGIAALALAIWLDWQISCLALLLSPVLALYYRFHGHRVRRASKRVLQENANLLGTIMESMLGAHVVKVHSAERAELRRFDDSNHRCVRAEFPLRWRKSAVGPTVEVLTTLTFSAIAVFAVSRIVNGATDTAQVLTTLIALVMAAASLRQFTLLFTEIVESSAAADRLLEVLALEMEPFNDHLARKSRKPDLPQFAREIEFKDVVFSYPDADRPAVDNVSLTIPQGSTVAFVGPNGSGKTTLIGLLPRLYDPASGRILIDGHDLREVSLRSLRNQIGVVTQETVLFRDTIAANVAYGVDETVSPARIRDVCRRAHADEFIGLKPDGYQTMLGDRGLTLSGGERQRIAIARALLRDPAILILDEATSMIDAESEAAITEALDEFCAQRTSLIIAHRLSTVVKADRIVVLDHGAVVDTGSHEELLGRCDLYQQLCRHQLVSDQQANGNNSHNAAHEPGSSRQETVSETILD